MMYENVIYLKDIFVFVIKIWFDILFIFFLVEFLNMNFVFIVESVFVVFFRILMFLWILL